MIKVDPKKMLIDAIVGVGFPSLEFASRMENLKLARFSGNQWNEAWEWNRVALEGLEVEHLENLYLELNELRD